MQVLIWDMESPVRMESRLFIERRPVEIGARRDRLRKIFHLRRSSSSFSVVALNVMTLWFLNRNITRTNKKGSVILGRPMFMCHASINNPSY